MSVKVSATNALSVVLPVGGAAAQWRFRSGERSLINPQMSALNAAAQRAADNGVHVRAGIVTLRARIRLIDLRQRFHDVDGCCNLLAATR